MQEVRTSRTHKIEKDMEQKEEHIGYLPIYYDPKGDKFASEGVAYYSEAIALDEAIYTVQYNKKVCNADIHLVEIAQVKCADRMAELHKRIRGYEYDHENPKFSKIFPF